MTGALSRRLVVLLATVLAGLAGVGAEAASSALDPTFGAGGKVVIANVGYDSLDDATVQPDGRVVAIGSVYTTAGYRAWVVRRNADGSPDTVFGSRALPAPQHGSSSADAVVTQPDGKIVVVGDLVAPYDIGVWRLLPNGDPDTNFGGGDGFVSIDSAGDESAEDVALGPGGTVTVVGRTTAGGGQAAVYRLTSAGEPDSTFDTDGALGVGPTGSSYGLAVAVQPDGRTLVTGEFHGDAQGSVYRLTTAGVLDKTFGGGDGKADVSGTFPELDDLLLQADGSVLVAGGITTLGGYIGAVLRLTPSGDLDTSYGGPSGYHLSIGEGEWIYQLEPLPGGGVAFLGETDVSDDELVGVLGPDGRLDTTFGDEGLLLTTVPRLVPVTHGLATTAEGRIVVVGDDGRGDNNGVLIRLQGVATTGGPPGPAAAATCSGKPATIVGTAGKDRLSGTAKADVIVALGGDDVVKGLGGDDLVCGGAGADRLSGGGGKDRLYGEQGEDRLSGGTGKDRLVGGPGRDSTHQ